MNERAVNNIESRREELSKYSRSLVQYIFMQYQIAKWHFNLMIRLSLLNNNNNIMFGVLDVYITKTTNNSFSQ